ncbi:hypothetical protein Hs30E_12670 [Lactococcus hodotermopsidis]|uniref:Uncharacterized protein n=1 Tax=Pseudolactococcus hodotermopsidis TaxID=2709157 RepID=A0A6A0BD02_9LACT|nr:hypothetical protein [Lactococcus hodotermopsidis]GFH42716.1 hypothetical protein Hs30E_12670 [Lactococcus hodotermopsidis]
MCGQKVTELEEQLNAENRVYFEELYNTLFLNGAIYNSQAVSETSYTLLLDLLAAQDAGENASGYFWVSPIQMSKRLLKNIFRYFSYHLHYLGNQIYPICEK